MYDTVRKQEYPTSANLYSLCTCGGTRTQTHQAFAHQASPHMRTYNVSEGHWVGPPVQGNAQITNTLPMQQTDDPVLITSIQALRSTAVNQGLVQRCFHQSISCPGA